MELGADMPDSVLVPYIKKQRPGQCVCLIYTSGTTGNPKGVMLSHDNLIFNGAALSVDIVGNMPEGEELK